MNTKHRIRCILAGTAIICGSLLAPLEVGATENTSAEQQQEFNEWYYASQANQDYYHWYTWVHASPENEAYWRWKTEQDRQARASHTGSVDGAITQHFGGPTTRLGAQARRVARCESEMNPNAKSPTNDHGLFQINARYHQTAFRNVTGAPFYNGVYNPYHNAKYARDLYNRQGWGPWTCNP